MRRLAAAARAAQIEAAAQRLGVEAESLSTAPSHVAHGGGRIAHGDLAKAAMQPDAQESPALKKGGFRDIGQSAPRMDLGEKSTGKATCGIGLSVPDI